MGMGAEEKEWGCRTNCASSRETPSRACLVNHELGRLPPSSTKGGFGGPSRTGIRTVGEAVVPHGRFTRQTLDGAGYVTAGPAVRDGSVDAGLHLRPEGLF